jgi:ketosteroid isomerase-like protein
MTNSIVRRRGLTLGAIALAAAFPVRASHAAPAFKTVTASAFGASDSADVVAIVAKFHSALAAGDSTTALALLSADALILESGSVETRADYRTHHLAADIEFARGVPSTNTVTRVTVQGDAAWVVSTSVSQGQVNGRSVTSGGGEIMVLRRVTSGWLISAIHWA